jgi:hypothetical protein
MSMIYSKTHAHRAAPIPPPYRCIAYVVREFLLGIKEGVEHGVARALAARRRGLALVLLGKGLMAADTTVAAVEAILVEVLVALEGIGDIAIRTVFFSAAIPRKVDAEGEGAVVPTAPVAGERRNEGNGGGDGHEQERRLRGHHGP